MALLTHVEDHGLFAPADIGSAAMRDTFERQGWIVLRSLFNPATDYRAVHRYINHLIDLKLEVLGLTPGPDSDEVRTGDYLRVCRADRAKGGEIYRACRQLLPLHQMSTSPQVIEMAKFLMKTDFINSNPFTAMRIDQVNEEKYLFDWHQDYPYTQGSQDGIVIWGSLFDLADGDGGIKLISASHRDGLRKVHVVDPKNASKNGGRSIQLENAQVYDEREAVRVNLKAGDVLLFSTLLVHKSVPIERGDVRWTFQIRHGNFSHPDAIARGWPGGSALGDAFEVSHPEYVES
jgi:hypothetical protein